eukprot:PhM_4_TR2275/c0_g1_i1/m.74156
MISTSIFRLHHHRASFCRRYLKISLLPLQSLHMYCPSRRTFHTTAPTLMGGGELSLDTEALAQRIYNRLPRDAAVAVRQLSPLLPDADVEAINEHHGGLLSFVRDHPHLMTVTRGPDGAYNVARAASTGSFDVDEDFLFAQEAAVRDHNLRMTTAASASVPRELVERIAQLVPDNHFGAIQHIYREMPEDLRKECKAYGGVGTVIKRSSGPASLGHMYQISRDQCHVARYTLVPSELGGDDDDDAGGPKMVGRLPRDHTQKQSWEKVEVDADGVPISPLLRTVLENAKSKERDMRRSTGVSPPPRRRLGIGDALNNALGLDKHQSPKAKAPSKPPPLAEKAKAAVVPDADDDDGVCDDDFVAPTKKVPVVETPAARPTPPTPPRARPASPSSSPSTAAAHPTSSNDNVTEDNTDEHTLLMLREMLRYIPTFPVLVENVTKNIPPAVKSKHFLAKETFVQFLNRNFRYFVSDTQPCDEVNVYVHPRVKLPERGHADRLYPAKNFIFVPPRHMVLRNELADVLSESAWTSEDILKEQLSHSAVFNGTCGGTLLGFLREHRKFYQVKEDPVEGTYWARRRTENVAPGSTEDYDELITPHYHQLQVLLAHVPKDSQRWVSVEALRKIPEVVEALPLTYRGRRRIDAPDQDEVTAGIISFCLDHGGCLEMSPVHALVRRYVLGSVSARDSEVEELDRRRRMSDLRTIRDVRARVLRADGENPYLDARALFVCLYNLLPKDRAVKIGDAVRMLPQRARVCLPEKGKGTGFFLRKAPKLIKVVEPFPGRVMVQRADVLIDDFLADTTDYTERVVARVLLALVPPGSVGSTTSQIAGQLPHSTRRGIIDRFGSLEKFMFAHPDIFITEFDRRTKKVRVVRKQGFEYLARAFPME